MSKHWLRAPRHLLVIFLVIVLLPSTLLVISGWQLMVQEESRASEERQAQMADVVVAELKQRIQGLETQLRQPRTTSIPASSRDDFVFVEFDGDRTLTSPHNLQLAFSPDLVARLSAAFPAAAAQLEVRGAWDGPLEYIIEDDTSFAAHRNIRTMTVEGETVSVQFAGPEPQGLKNGDLVRVQGARIGNVLAVSDASIIAPALDGPLTCSTLGEQRSIVLMVTMPDAPAPADITTGDMTDTFFNPDRRSLNGYWSDASFGQTWATGEVRGWYTLDRVYSCDESSAIRTAAIAAADGDVDFTHYTRVFIIVNGMTGTCTWGGLGTLACGTLTSADGTFTASTSWMRPGYFDPDFMLEGFQIAAHEGGHNIGLRHSNSRDYGSVSLGPIGSAGVVTEYNDLFSAMGRLHNRTYPEPWVGGGHYTASQKLQLGWLSEAQVPTVTESGSFLVEPLEIQGGSVQALRIVRGTKRVRGVTTTHSIWVEYRQPIGDYDSTLYPQVFGGALIHYQDDTNAGASHLLDMTPNVLISSQESSNPEIRDWSNPALVGTWIDGYTGISLTTSSPSPVGLSVDVVFGPVTCVTTDPTVTISPANPTALAGTSVVYTLSVTSNDSPACGSRTFTLSSSSPAGWGTSFSPVSITLAPTATGTVSMTKIVPAGTSEGTHTVDAVATSTDGTHAGTGCAECTVAPALPPMVTTVSPLGTYPKNSTVPIAVTVLRTDSTPVSGASVLFTVTPPTGSPATRAVLTDATGRATWNYKVAPKGAAGTYIVTAQATLGDETSTSVPEDFIVSP